MTQTQRKHNILVVSQTPDLAEIIRKAIDRVIEVDYAPGQAEALEKIRTTRPDIVILGKMESPEAVVKFCQQLHEGWISRHSSVLVVDLDSSEDSHCPSAEELEVGIGEYNYLTGGSGSLMPEEFLLPRLKEKIDAMLAQRENRLKAAIGPNKFCLILEQIPGMGAFERRQALVLENASRAAKDGKICAISVTDNPGGNPAIATEILSREIRQRGLEPLVHLALRDRSRNQCESLLYQLAAMDINNLLVLTGDYPSNIGFKGRSKPVFDLDSINGLQLISEMNRGMEHEIMRKKTTLAPTNFFTGVAFSPYKREEAEVMGQYNKLKKKIAAGANFVITQVGFDVRKLHELKLWLKTHGYEIPVMVSVYILTYGTARVMRANRVPGCVVTDKLLEQLAGESTSPDKGSQARLERAPRMYAIVRGMGFAGASISGQDLPYESVQYVINRGEELLGSWPDFLGDFDYPQENGFYFFKRDAKNGLNLETPANRDAKPSRSLSYYFSRAVHALVFEPRGPLFRIMRFIARRVDSSKALKKVFGVLEYWTKTVLYSCANCGDCALFDVAYLCPVSQCPKNQRNGPCGGSYQGWCEVYPDEKQCIWVRAYLRLKSQNREDTIGENIIPPCNWELWQSPSWLNYFMGRDHVSRRLNIETDNPG